MYYTGPGVLTSGGKDYGASDKLPDGLSKKLIDSLRKKGRISDLPLAAKMLKSEPSITVDELAEVNRRLQDQNAELSTRLAMADEKISEANSIIAEANKTIEALTEQLTASAGAVGAGPVKKKP